MNLLSLLKLLGKIAEAINLMLIKMKIAKAKESIDEGFKEGDQSKIESQLGDPAGPSSKSEFPLLYERPHKKPEES